MPIHQTPRANGRTAAASGLVAFAVCCSMLLAGCATPREAPGSAPEAPAPTTSAPERSPGAVPGDELHDAAVSLDPDRPAAADDTVVHLLVMEQACHGGEDAEGRVELVTLEETDTTVEISIGVRPDTSADAWTCQSNPATPFAIELAEPLGDREVVDVGVDPAQPLEARAPGFAPPTP